jgi:two-component system OmpR family sensor kinase
VGASIVVAIPTTQVDESLNQLVLIEVVAAAVLLGLLAVGSWLVLRRGLRPLEQMATSARSITAGDLSQRVAPADDRSEVGQLGLALNTMLGDLETSFDERAATEQRLRQFLSDASHELRTPLTSIQGFAELFRLGADQDPQKLAISLRRIEEESARMKTLVDDLLLLARLDETRAPERTPVDLAVIAADACRDAVAAQPDRPVTLDAPEPVLVAGDEDHLRQAVANLVTNAWTHTPAGTAIEVTAAIDDGQATIRVRDHGRGLDDDAVAHAFDRFWQANPARSGGGAGLGLSIVAAVAEEHGGSASASNASGGGACFVMHLPLSASETSSDAP